MPLARRVRRSAVRFAVQAGVWFVLSLAIATMLVVGGPFRFADALRFSVANWMPWALVTPLVFWVSRRFPLMRGHLLRGIPVHLLTCALCSMAVSWITARFPLSFTPKMRPPFDAPPGAVKRFRFGPGEPEITQVSTGVGPFAPAGSVIGFGTAGRSFVFSGPGAPPEYQVVIDSVSVNEPMPPVPFSVPLGPPPPPRPDIRVDHVGPVTGGALSVALTDWRLGWQMFLVPLAMRANVGFALYFIIASAAHAIGFYRQAQARQRQALALAASRNQAKLDALRLQLQPHFLFNTLNAIATLVHFDAKAADKLIGDLSDLLRVSLQTTTHEVTLARELELLDHYLAIEQARLDDRLRIVRDIDPAALGACVPTLILQPLAENAVRHGIETRLAPGTLTVRAKRVGDTLELTVADDGIGFDAQTSRPGRRGIGLANSEERLRTLHGDQAALRIVSPPEGGVRVEITLPFRTEPLPAESGEGGDGATPGQPEPAFARSSAAAGPGA